MSPRGVAIPEVRQQLFAALERVIARDGLGGLSGRAVTREAGVSAGLLHAHFTDFDEFLVGYAVNRSFQASAHAAALPGRAGMSTVADNLTEALLAPPVLALSPLVSLMAARPSLHGRVDEVLGRGSAGLAPIGTAVAAYLSEEKDAERLAPNADHEAIAMALVGTLHHLLLTGRLEALRTDRTDGRDDHTRLVARSRVARALARDRIARVVHALVGVLTSGSPPSPGRSTTEHPQT